ncbi:MAG: calcium-binding protein [Sphingomonas sp.]|nr:calcium-binding protein [Sphingomonas sp.]
MAQFTGGTMSAVRLDQLAVGDLLDAEVISNSSTSLRLDMGDGEIDTFTGVGFTFGSGGEPTGGTITGINVSVNGNTTLDVTGLSTSATQFYSYLPGNDNAGVLNLILSGNDNMNGSRFDDFIVGLGGHDNLFGLGGSDTLSGGAGNDHLYGQSANGGDDGADKLSGGDGSDYLQGNAGNDTLDGGEGSDRINGGANEDMIAGSGGNDTVNGNLGNDTIDGGQGNDSLRGGKGDDSIVGGDGDDVISGDLGVDKLTGGAGVDYFIFGGSSAKFANASADSISDFQDGTDRLHVGYNPAAILTGSAQSSFSAATEVAQQLFEGHAGDGEVAVLAVGSDTYVFYSSTGGGTADSAILISNLAPSAIGASDFI